MTATRPIPASSLSRGSEWRRWDLHIHSPASALNNQFPRLKNGEPDWDAYIAKLESLSGISAMGITDYFTIEGYKKVLEYRSKGRLRNIDLVLPNIEFRLDKIITTGKVTRRLNYHVIFSDTVSPEQIEEHFLQELKFCFEGDACYQIWHFSFHRVPAVRKTTELKRHGNLPTTENVVD